MKLQNFPTPLAPLLALLCRLALGIVFFYAGIEKIIAPGEFAVAIYNYRLLPDWAVNVLAVFLPWLEVFVAAGLITGKCGRGSSLLSALLFLVFATGLTVSLIRGLDISCGCFGASKASINWLYLLRDGGLLIMSIFTLFADRGWSYFIKRD